MTTLIVWVFQFHHHFYSCGVTSWDEFRVRKRKVSTSTRFNKYQQTKENVLVKETWLEPKENQFNNKNSTPGTKGKGKMTKKSNWEGPFNIDYFLSNHNKLLFCKKNNHKLDKNNDIVSPHDTQVGFLRIKASVLHLIKNFQSSPFLLFLHFT